MNNNILAGLEIYKCTGCQVCAASCPTKAIVIQLDKYGFYTPQLSEDKCIQCGICKDVCYKYDAEILSTDIKEKIPTYAARCVDREILKKSSSGGLFTILGTHFIKSGYKVAGVGYDYKNDIAVGRIVNTVGQLDELCGSKYMQAYSEAIFREILNDTSGSRFAVFGTPCQIYALNKRIAKLGNRKNYILIDIFCHGCPSLFLWTKYVADYKEKIGCSELKKIIFRSKIYGWHEYCHEFITSSGKNIKTRRFNDPFFDIFFDNQILNRACYDCRLRGSLKYSDIRLGDYWGSQYDMNTKGVSLVTCNTRMGREILQEVREKLKLKPGNLRTAVKAQSFKTEYHFDESEYRTNLNLLRADKDITDIYRIYQKRNRECRMARIGKRFLMYCPGIVRRALKKTFHVIKEEKSND